MSKLAHSNDNTMDEIEFWRAYEDRALNYDMETAPRDGREVIIALNDDMAPSNHKVRMIRAVPGRTLYSWVVTNDPLKGCIFFNQDMEGWLEC